MDEKMGTYFTALFGYSFNDYQEVKFFKQFLQNNDKITSHLKSLSEFASPSEIKWEWMKFDWEDTESQFLSEGYVGIEATDYGRFLIGRNVCELTIFMGWSFFLKDKRVREVIRKLCKELSIMIGNPIYVPEHYNCSNFIYEGGTKDLVLSSLKKQFGLPCKEIDSMLIEYEDFWDTSGYYIDEFIDLSN